MGIRDQGGSSPAASTKYDQVARDAERVLAAVERFHIAVLGIPWAHVLEKAEVPLNPEFDRKRRGDPLGGLEAGMTREVWARKVWNTLRHECTNYDDGLSVISKLVRGNLHEVYPQAYERLRERVTEAIVKEYPHLAGSPGIFSRPDEVPLPARSHEFGMDSSCIRCGVDESIAEKWPCNLIE